ncbi:TonB-dependent receptor [Sphingopyxis sp. H038]|uniref:TonB-dependent receptor domain-containing protein n=1 Tax=unclassified Sphingopyxis TaxID=2614943 RepID=UPI0007315D07|nr:MULTISPECIES: TonB-dependent receptor [unclassified Sphingopyxis]KTE02368.1 TonB-dependent receptor [Sphingopyxis sp. H012]KTE09648.1 TonB-dependent receptor [Sphingopyxis sp. H093]KTE10929.1 TonB-dependent receptor [Sphingopyxis sp. H053]KTE26086.1 TonB-dependent receptor [Sphingopyxis sp. H080]KTE35416.1 TonB-dependent receptor [Sphingopyxis sp. H038]
MKKTQYSKLRLGAAPLVLSVALVSAPAFAQDAAEETAAQSEIVVTGSLIRNPNLEQSTPVNVTTSDTIELKQSNVAEEVLREMPGVVPSMGSAVNNGNTGGSYVDLRGLGSTRNIVLLNGNRVAPSDVNGRVDLNNIPLALIERVDALTGAAVTTYGADAITGVVNFVTKRDFAGLEVTASNQITEQGDGNVFRVDATIGANFDDGRGNAVLSIGYQSADAVYQGDRDFSFFQVDSYTGGNGGSGTAVPSRFSGTRPLIAGTNTPNLDPTVVNGGVRQVNAAGQAVAPFASFNFNPDNIFQTPFERYNIYGQANYEVSDAIEVYTRGMFSKNKVSTIIAPSGSFGGTVTINLNNPFLPATLRNQFCAFNTATPASGLYTPRFTPGECAAAAAAPGRTNADGTTNADYREVTVTLNRRTPEVGPRISDYQTTFFDYRVGARGGITDTIDWNLEGAYGESENIQNIQGYTLQSRWRQGSLVNGTLAAPVCQDASNGCVPINLFGPEGSITPDMAGFLQENSTSTNRTTLSQVRAIVSGDVGFASPLAVQPIGFALGGEYRKYTAQQASDLLAKTPGELGGAGGAAPDIDGAYDVYEAYAEIVAPLVEDKPFFESLTLEAGIRYSDYSIKGAGGYDTWTWKAGGSWEPGAGVKFRGNYSRAVRAPNIGELFTPTSVGLTNLGLDPCAGAAPTANANLRAICIAQGAPVGTIGSITNPTAAQANITTGGNLNLQPETANTWTLGVVFQPDFLPRFNLSVDYYNIKIDDVLGVPLPGDIINACFGAVTAASASDPACTSIRRNPITGGLDGDPATTAGLFGTTNNLGRLFTDGVDLLMNYNADLGFASLDWSFVGNWTRSSKFNANAADPDSINRECVGFYSVNCSFTGSIQPEFQFSNRFTFGFDKVDLSLLWRWQDSVQFEPLQLQADLDAALASPADCPDPNGADTGGCMVNPEFRKIKAAHYFDLTGRFSVSDNLTVTLTVQNLLNKKPPIVGNSIGSTTYNSGNTYPSSYDALGRRYAVSAKLKF